MAFRSGDDAIYGAADAMWTRSSGTAPADAASYKPMDAAVGGAERTAARARDEQRIVEQHELARDALQRFEPLRRGNIATSAPGLGSPLPHLHRDCHICTGTGLAPLASAPALGR